MKKLIENRVNALKGIGIKHVFLLNHHGGKGQFDLIKEMAKDLSDPPTKVHGLRTYQFNDLTKEDGWYGVGGHAGYSETTWLMAIRPELIDLTRLPEGELSVRKYGILHKSPTIEAEWNPRNVKLITAQNLKISVLKNFVNYINDLK